MAKKNNLAFTADLVSSEAHPLEKAIENGGEFKAVGIMRIPGTNQYCSFTAVFKGRELTSIQASEPDQKAIGEESAKIRFVHEFMTLSEDE